MNLTLPDEAVRLMAAEIAHFGASSLETGGFLLAPRGDASVAVVALAGEHGIGRSRDLFQMSDLALDRLFSYAESNDLWIPAQFHSHGRHAFLSRTDIDHGLCVEGFITTVVPHYADPRADPGLWGWWVYNKKWTEIAPPHSSARPAGAIKFDEGGVHAA